jgi:DNA polymerase III sliding clamp (beta) subunit (PCNA family)
MSMVATDGHRLRSSACESPGKKANGDVLLPRDAEQVARLIDGGEGVQFSRGETTLFLRRRAAADFRKIGANSRVRHVIPSNDKRIDFDRDRLSAAVRRHALLRMNDRRP